MDKLARNVIARYLEGPVESPSLENRDWMSYQKEKQEGSPKAPKVVLKMLKDVAKGENIDHKKNLSKPFTQYNPYDYTSPSDKPKDTKDSPPITNDNAVFPASGMFNKPNLFKDDKSLKKWYESRREDSTTDETEQQPAISITRKYAVVARYLSHILPVEYYVEASDENIKTAATFDEIINADTHYKGDEKIDKASQVTLSPVTSKKNLEKGRFVFKATSPQSAEEIKQSKNKKGSKQPYTTTVQLLRPVGKRPATYLQYPVEMSCTCDSFLYYGAQYYAVHGRYMNMGAFRPSLVPPTPQDMTSGIHKSDRYPEGKKHPGRGLNFRVCKHLLAVYNWMESNKMRVTKYYRQYPEMGPASKLINTEVWEEFMGFPFSEEEFKRRLKKKKPQVPKFFASSFFHNKKQSIKLNQWFKDVWINRNDNEKVKILNTLVMHPEEIFFILVKDALYNEGNISDYLINIGYDLISRTVKDVDKEEPEGPEDTKPGTGVIIPPDKGEDVEDPGEVSKKDKSEEKAEEGPEKEEERKPSDVEPIIKDVSSPAERNKEDINDTSNLNTNL